LANLTEVYEVARLEDLRENPRKPRAKKLVPSHPDVQVGTAGIGQTELFGEAEVLEDVDYIEATKARWDGMTKTAAIAEARKMRDLAVEYIGTVRVSEAWFQEFWRAYPKRVGESAARRKYKTVIQGGAGKEEILDGAHRYAEHVSSEGMEARFVAAPTVWLNQGRWTDELGSMETREDVMRRMI